MMMVVVVWVVVMVVVMYLCAWVHVCVSEYVGMSVCVSVIMPFCKHAG